MVFKNLHKIVGLDLGVFITLRICSDNDTVFWGGGIYTYFVFATSLSKFFKANPTFMNIDPSPKITVAWLQAAAILAATISAFQIF